MGKREEQSFAEELPDATCEPESRVHLLRQAPRGTVSALFGAGKIISMNRKKSAPAAGDKSAGDLSESDKRRMTDQIGRQLRGMYDGLLNQPVPDRFMELMKQLEGGERDAERDQ